MATNYANTNDQKLGRFLYVHVQLIGGNKDDAPHKISFYRSNWKLCFFFPTRVLYISPPPRPCEVVDHKQESHRGRTQPNAAMANGDNFIIFPEEVGYRERK